MLGVGDVRLVGVDLPLHSEPARYREVVERIKLGEHELGALITTHKIDVFEACRDLFDALDENAELCGEASFLAKREGSFIAGASDPISSGRALAEFHSGDVGEVLCLGGGGSATAITVHLLQHNLASGITVVNRSAPRLAAMRTVHAKLDPRIEVRYVENSDPSVNDRLVSALPPTSMVINATGMGKDRRGSPLTDDAVFPERGYAWDFNYRGELEFLRQARRQAGSRHVHVEDGWRYFIHGWAVVMDQVFDVAIGADVMARLSEVSEAERPHLP